MDSEDEFLQIDPSDKKITELKSLLTRRGCALPVEREKKDYYVQLFREKQSEIQNNRKKTKKRGIETPTSENKEKIARKETPTRLSKKRSVPEVTEVVNGGSASEKKSRIESPQEKSSPNVEEKNVPGERRVKYQNEPISTPKHARIFLQETEQDRLFTSPVPPPSSVFSGELSNTSRPLFDKSTPLYSKSAFKKTDESPPLKEIPPPVKFSTPPVIMVTEENLPETPAPKPRDMPTTPVDISPGRKVGVTRKSEPQHISWLAMLYAISMLILWFLEVGSLIFFCFSNVGQASFCPSGSEPQANCKPCPTGGHCDEWGQLASCTWGYVQEGNTCVKDSNLHRTIIPTAIEIVEKHKGDQLCHQTTYGGMSMSEVQQELITRFPEAKHLLSENYVREIFKSGVSSQVGIFAGDRFVSENARYSLLCIVKMNKHYLFSSFLILTGLFAIVHQYRVYCMETQLLVLLEDFVLHQLKNLSRDHFKQPTSPKEISLASVQQQTTEFCSKFKCKSKSKKIFEKLRKMLAKNQNIEESTKFINGQQHAVLTWNGSVE